MKKFVSVLVSVAVLGLMPVAEASHKPNSHCSSSGDVCKSSEKVDGVRKLRITLQARYFNRYELCVVAPDGSRTCKNFRIQEQGSAFGDSVRWSTNFPNKGRGAYVVVWKFTNGDRIGRKLGFHV